MLELNIFLFLIKINCWCLTVGMRSFATALKHVLQPMQKKDKNHPGVRDVCFCSCLSTLYWRVNRALHKARAPEQGHNTSFCALADLKMFDHHNADKCLSSYHPFSCRVKRQLEWAETWWRELLSLMEIPLLSPVAFLRMPGLFFPWKQEKVANLKGLLSSFKLSEAWT